MWLAKCKRRPRPITARGPQHRLRLRRIGSSTVLPAKRDPARARLLRREGGERFGPLTSRLGPFRQVPVHRSACRLGWPYASERPTTPSTALPHHRYGDSRSRAAPWLRQNVSIESPPAGTRVASVRSVNGSSSLDRSTGVPVRSHCRMWLARMPSDGHERHQPLVGLTIRYCDGRSRSANRGFLPAT